ncbi:MAG TPA: tRNA (N(6)-L-threonylcarbamoyladenosine(37)-C(2))-methylthiotransferase MtaB [Thermoanaerobaculia bacterium]|nr:tRNA (N(6)-L-threonylcarbamoyladenosine(37)-C(2))-methylthiotransferase MtaB [Thermoanaerobaculia bacterium]
MRVFLSSLGCKLNQAESERFARQLLARGHAVVGQLAEADVHVVNSCTVTSAAAAESRRAVRRSRREAPHVRTVLTGCYVSGSPAEAAALEEADLVVGNEGKEGLVDRVHQAFGLPLPPELPIPYCPLPVGRARATVKVGDGCDMRCAFCIIPITRGRETSRPLREVVAEVSGLVAGGYREVVVTGVQISDWKEGNRRLYDLVSAVMGETAVPRLRLTSIAPWGFDRRLLSLFADRRLCRHLHLSLQSGATSTLRRMRRPYSAEAYRGLVESIAAAVPGIGLTTDVIVGFPGETEEEHRLSRDFVAGLPLAKTHVFPYSSRPGTPAASFAGHLHGTEVRRRAAEMHQVAAQVEQRFARSQMGETLEVLWETSEGNRWQGHADNYLRVETEAGVQIRNTVTRTKIVGFTGRGAVGIKMY